MDREISTKQKRKRKRKLALRAGIPVILTIGVVTGIILATGNTVPESDLELCEATTGDIETSVDATGKVIPAFEEILVSPVATRIMEVYRQEGDRVEAGTPLLRLDLEEAEKNVRNMADELDMRHLDSEMTRLNSNTYLTNLRMKIKTKEMSVAELKAETRNERRLDSLGSGTGDRVRQAELEYETARLELEQMRKEYENETRAHAAAGKSKRLEENVTAKNLELLRRTLDDARVKAPREGTLTFLNSSVGSSIGAGERLAVLADLSRFKVSADMPEGESPRLAPGAKAIVRVGNRRLSGSVVQVNPQSSNGTVSFTVRLDRDNDPALKSGLRATVSVVYDVLDKVIMIRNGAYYKGPGTYWMFVEDGKGNLEKRRVLLGESNYDHVEVKSGVRAGERVAVGDMERYSGHSTLKIRKRQD